MPTGREGTGSSQRNWKHETEALGAEKMKILVLDRFLKGWLDIWWQMKSTQKCQTEVQKRCQSQK